MNKSALITFIIIFILHLILKQLLFKTFDIPNKDKIYLENSLTTQHYAQTTSRPLDDALPEHLADVHKNENKKKGYIKSAATLVVLQGRPDAHYL